MVARLRVTGIRGFLQDERRTLDVGDELSVGRSRDADLSVRRAPRFLARRDRDDLLSSERMRSISRIHLRIHYHALDRVEIVDCSRNGTYLDRKRIDDAVELTDLPLEPHELTVGSSEKLRLELVGPGDD